MFIHFYTEIFICIAGNALWWRLFAVFVANDVNFSSFAKSSAIFDKGESFFS